MSASLLSVGIDIGTSTTQLILSRLTLANRANPFSVPRIAIEDREVLYRSGIHFTPLLSDTVIDAEGVRTIVAEEYRKSGFAPEQVDTGAVIITGETARKENAREVLSALSQFAGDLWWPPPGRIWSPFWPPGGRARMNTPGSITRMYYTLTSAAAHPTWRCTPTESWRPPAAWTWAGG